MVDQEQAKEQYKSFVKGERLTYAERSKIVQFDQKSSAFDKMDMRVSALTELEIFEDLDTTEQIEKWESTRCDEEMINSLVEKEYYQLSSKEKQESCINNQNREEVSLGI
ncbi:hypothetical protein [Enterococcus termitis]|uniref:Uncharacterized protein n=1 Tax=Enterococcus termitis TaxID=332950 RepID=A0A1E5H1D1_9ENTE|nr:hypothetical protein [Enterococcus termitis]OEG18704.1 hypothetical protein BCR25_16015 [Enterococcus termitis]